MQGKFRNSVCGKLRWSSRKGPRDHCGRVLTGLLRKIRTTGRVAEPAPPAPLGEVLPQARRLSGSAQVRCVDAGSCNGCGIEIAAAFNPVYDAERYGARLVASPRHADVALVTGPVTRNTAEPLRRRRCPRVRVRQGTPDLGGAAPPCPSRSGRGRRKTLRLRRTPTRRPDTPPPGGGSSHR
ncbi:hypothetical protein [Streptomyces sp. NRRL B-24572]|uniref:NADH-quinone oxidoreductase subunit B family protein n=1 Tax=Streptomyces sp. NRRL B-24572 TaxID=1962156 RepID=UPI00277D0A2C|nr:hypothetical protein [Streptomyces sp. NRRL B-24572]